MSDCKGWTDRFRNVPVRRFISMVVLLLACGNVWAQTTGALLGMVTDQNGAVVPSATVRATNTDTGFTATVKPSAEGSYLISSLPVGHYTISVDANGFKTYSASGVLIPVAQNIRLDVKLEIGGMTETVSVTGNAINIDASSATLGTTVDTARLEGLPLNGRNAVALIQTLPGVATESAPLAVTFRSGPSFSISGSQSNAGNVMLDGATLTDALSNTSQQLPSVDSLEEFRVLESSYSAEYGRAGGSVMLAVTKSGTNRFHGSLWDYLRNDAFDAANAYTPAVNGVVKKPLLRQNQFGGALGGPVLLPGYNGRNRTFFFVSYQGLRVHQQGIALTTPLTAAERTGDFSDLLPGKVVTDPTTGLPFPGNIIPKSRIDAYASNLIAKFMPLPNQPDGTYRILQPTPSTSNQVSVKVDQKLGASDRLFFRYYRFLDSNTGASPYSAFSAPVTGSLKSFTGGETHTFNANLINEFDASYTNPHGLIAVATLPSARELGINMNQEHPMPPGVSTSTFGFGGNWLIDEPSTFQQFDDKILWTHGRHSITTGIMIMRMHHKDLAYPGWNFGFSGQYTGDSRTDFMIGRPNSFGGLTTINDDCTSGLYQPFIQDDFRINSRLTLNAGLRYDLQTTWTQKRGGYAASNFVPGLPQSQTFPQAPPGFGVPGDKGVPGGIYNIFKTPFAPRLGIAWDPTGRGITAIRAGWGIYHAVVREEVIAFATNNEPFLVSFNFTPPSTSDPWAGRGDPLPYDPTTPRFTYTMTQTHLDPNYRQADTQQFNVSIQHRLSTDLFAQAAYVGNVSHHLDQQREFNQPKYYSPNVDPQSRRPWYPQYYDSMPSSFSTANSNYHSLQLEMQKRMAKSYTLQASYTWSKMIDNTAPPQDSYNPGRPERALSSLNRSHVFGVNGLWDLPTMKGRGILTYIVGGWRLSGIVRYNTGGPSNVLLGFDNALIGPSRFNGGSQRPNVNGNPNSGNRSRSALESGAQYFNTAAFSQPAQGTFGNSGRNTVINPGSFTNDLSLQKIFTMPGETGKVTFRAEAFNATNWTNLGAPVTTWNSPQFGQINYSGDARIAQFALRYDF